MIVRNIRATNFRTLEKFDLDFKSGYCALSGKNNAGKSAVVRVIDHFLKNRDDEHYMFGSTSNINFSIDKTQWSDSEDMQISMTVEVDRECDSEVFYVVETFSESEEEQNSLEVTLTQSFTKGDGVKSSCVVSGKELDVRQRNEIFSKFRSAPNFIYHNSTNIQRSYFYWNESFTEILEHHFSSDDREKISAAQKTLQNRIRKAARQHKDELDSMLGKLSDKYEVELSSIEARPEKIPLQISLKDKLVGSPLHNWGSGTQNRTRVLMSVLDAIHTRESAAAENKTTPIILVEEPESFLHPSAQAEFGQVLNNLAVEFNLQIIATTHSPYMLNQHRPEANFLLERRVFRGAAKETEIVDTNGSDWMRPFAEALGVVPSEFESWRNAFAAQENRVILVEGEIDKKYFEIFRDRYANVYNIPKEIEIVPYEGKDALKNTAILNFMINKFSKVFITFDLDSLKEVEPALKRIGLKLGHDYLPVGLNKPGYDCVEGLLPEGLRKEIYAANLDQVTALGSADSQIRRKAKADIKKEMLRSFENQTFPTSELEGFKNLFAKVGKAFA